MSLDTPPSERGRIFAKQERERIAERLSASLSRESGPHRWLTTDSKAVVALSEPTWEGFWERLNQLSETPRLVVSPELMTFPQDPGIASTNRALIEERIDLVRQASALHPETDFLLGSILFLEDDTPANAVLHLQDGKVLGTGLKRTLGPYEQSLPALPDQPALTVERETSVLICSDFYFAAPQSKYTAQYAVPVSPETRTLLVPSCWAIDTATGNAAAGAAYLDIGLDEYFAFRLSQAADRLMRAYPAVNDIVVCDRVSDVSIIDRPYNTHFQRK